MFSAGKEVILSRGEMIEIGGSFRMPDIVRQTGCRLVEVGCTNKTHLRDYEEAITPETGAILHCHQSNYKMIGFVERQSLRDVCELARRTGVTVIEDIGAGCLLDTSRFGLPKEETLQEAVEAGPDLILFSGDKLLGGPQCGIILGKAEVLAKVKKHPLARAVRVDKLTMATLEATLRMYTSGREMELPVWRYISRDAAEVKSDAQRIAAAFAGSSVLEQGITEVGGGSVPGHGVPTWRIGLEADDAEALLAKLRRLDPPLIGRIEEGRVWLDPRTLDDDEVDAAIRAITCLEPAQV
jgi:L-seryl-tRNA(Ser) seleniumtransferase